MIRAVIPSVDFEALIIKGQTQDHDLLSHQLINLDYILAPLGLIIEFFNPFSVPPDVFTEPIACLHSPLVVCDLRLPQLPYHLEQPLLGIDSPGIAEFPQEPDDYMEVEAMLAEAARAGRVL